MVVRLVLQRLRAVLRTAQTPNMVLIDLEILKAENDSWRFLCCKTQERRT